MSELKEHEIREIQIDILKTVTEFCIQEKLRYFLGYGTLLGAVRHKGYIPWDDDIDVLMPRPDYEKLINNFNKQNIEYKVFTATNDPDYPWPYAKISHEKTVLIERSDIKFNKLGVNIDVFPIDGLPDSDIEQKKIVKSITMQRNLLNIKSISISSGRAIYKNVILHLGKFFLSLFNYRKIIKKINRKSTMFSYEQSKYVGCLVWGYGTKEIMKKNYFDKRIKLEFEGTKFYAPAEYHQVLTQIYGDYMQLPPEGERLTHHSNKAYYK